MKEESKSPAIEHFLDDLTHSLFGRRRSESIKSLDCVACGETADEFHDELSKKEFDISGLCQECQDDIFG